MKVKIKKETQTSEIRRIGETILINFVILKLVDVIDWSWIWVLSPIWITTLFAVSVWGISKLIDNN